MRLCVPLLLGAARARTAVSVRQRGSEKAHSKGGLCTLSAVAQPPDVANVCCREQSAWLAFTQRVTIGFFGLELLVRILGHGRYYFMFKRNAADAAVIAYLVCAQVTCETMVRFLCAGCTSNRFWLN